MKIAIIGTGYVGLVTGACFAEVGHDVTCVDIDRAKVDRINRGESPIYEEGLLPLLRRHSGSRLHATSDLRGAVAASDMTFIAVGTPFDGARIDLSYIRRAACDIAAALRSISAYHVVVVKSTVVPGTTDEVVLPLLEQNSGKRAGVDFGVGMNPEFLTEGVAVQDFLTPDRIVLGGMDDRTVEVLAAVYSPFQNTPIVRTNNRTAETIKYASNAVLATLISFSNEIGNFCTAKGGIDVAEVMQSLHLSRYFTTTLSDGTRVTAPITSFLYAGCGFGGSCLPKDVKALIACGTAVGHPMPLLDAVIKINLEQPYRMIEILEKHFPSLHGLKVSVLGLAFKPDTDDMRESPALPIIKELLARDVVVSVYDPVAINAAKRVLPVEHVQFHESFADALQGVDATLLVTSWSEFRELPVLLDAMASPPLVVDGRRMLDKHRIPRYAGIGL